jgi:hypothetical protein
VKKNHVLMHVHIAVYALMENANVIKASKALIAQFLIVQKNA